MLFELLLNILVPVPSAYRHNLDISPKASRRRLTVREHLLYVDRSRPGFICDCEFATSVVVPVNLHEVFDFVTVFQLQFPELKRHLSDLAMFCRSLYGGIAVSTEIYNWNSRAFGIIEIGITCDEVDCLSAILLKNWREV